MTAGRAAVVLAGAAAASLLLGGCESGDDKRSESELERAPAASVCVTEATSAATPYPGDFPEGFPLPPATIVYRVEDRGAAGTVATAVSSTDFEKALDFLNHEAVHAGFAITSGETEEHDAEANWRGNGYVGRWAIRESADCPGETVIQVLAGRR